jgi:hypothetical protein
MSPVARSENSGISVYARHIRMRPQAGCEPSQGFSRISGLWVPVSRAQIAAAIELSADSGAARPSASRLSLVESRSPALVPQWS